MGMTITHHPGGAITRKFDSLEELQAWAKENITNKAVLDAVMTPISTTRRSPQATSSAKEKGTDSDSKPASSI